MAHELCFQIPNQLSELTGLSGAITAHLQEKGGDDAAVYAASLALEELFTNIIKYGYDDQEAHLITVSLKVGPEVFRLEISDDGHPFNPFDQPGPDLSVPLEERQIGGLGIHFIRNLLDRYEYERRDGWNVVAVEKRLRNEGL
ncbi:MAG TPA: ATP-binding protein [Chthoniobacteraceae bacterium]|nr:ATP-binding protein [Chthoniobacteraceae bacterium]